MGTLPTLHEIVEGLPDALIVCDSDMQMVYVNRRAEAMLVYPDGDLLGRSIDVIVPLRDLERHREATRGYLAHLSDAGSGPTAPEGLPCRVARGDGSEVNLLVTASKVTSHGDTFYLASLHPVVPTAPVAESSTQLRQAQRRSPIVIGTVDRDLRYTWIYNPDPHFPLERALGKRDDELATGQGIKQLMAFKQSVLDTGQPDDTTIEFHLGDEVRTYDIFGSPLQDETGETVAVTTVSVDVSHLRTLLRVQREFIGMIAHDLRQPLAIIQGRTQLMLKRREYDDDGLYDLLRQSQRLGRMVEDLLETSAVESGRLQLNLDDCELTEILRRVSDHASQQSTRHQFRLELDAAEVRGTWDGARIEQVVENLVGNAIKYSPGGGEIVVALTTTAGEASVAISDQGIGMVPDDLSGIFDCFVRTSEARRRGIDGLGLGLCIVKGLVEAHGGRVSASSDGPGCGSTLAFTLPFTPPPVPPHLTR